jgi:hypothetical protein
MRSGELAGLYSYQTRASWVCPDISRVKPREEVGTMAASIIIEVESGTSTGRVHSHDGYYAGDFSSPGQVAPAAWHTPVPRFDAAPC